MSIEQLPHVCQCQECQADLRIRTALEHADQYYTQRQQQTQAAIERMELATVIRFPQERVKR